MNVLIQKDETQHQSKEFWKNQTLTHPPCARKEHRWPRGECLRSRLPVPLHAQALIGVAIRLRHDRSPSSERDIQRGLGECVYQGVFRFRVPPGLQRVWEEVARQQGV